MSRLFILALFVASGLARNQLFVRRKSSAILPQCVLSSMSNSSSTVSDCALACLRTPICNVFEYGKDVCRFGACEGSGSVASTLWVAEYGCPLEVQGVCFVINLTPTQKVRGKTDSAEANCKRRGMELAVPETRSALLAIMRLTNKTMDEKAKSICPGGLFLGFLNPNGYELCRLEKTTDCMDYLTDDLWYKQPNLHSKSVAIHNEGSRLKDEWGMNLPVRGWLKMCSVCQWKK